MMQSNKNHLISDADIGIPRRIALHAQAEIRIILIEIARELKKRYGSRIWLYCLTQQDLNFYKSKNNDGLFEAINCEPGYITRYFFVSNKYTDGQTSEDIFQSAREHEKRIGIPYNHLIMSNRHFGRGFSLGGFYHPRSPRSENTDQVTVTKIYNKLIEFWENEFDEHDFDLFIHGDKVPAVIAHSRGVPWRAMVMSRFKGFHFWADNEFEQGPDWSELTNAVTDYTVPELIVPYHRDNLDRKRTLASLNFLTMTFNIFRVIAKRLYWIIRRYEKSKSYFLKDVILFHINRRSAFKKLIRQATVSLKELDGKDFIFFPLHEEPESALQVGSLECFDQLGVISALARDLPAGMILAVKEHIYAIGRRPDLYYYQIDLFKNVVLVDPLEKGIEIVSKAKAVATINGTSGFEAAIIGTPVLQFCKRSMYEHMEHVFKVSTDQIIYSILVKVQNGDIDLEKAKVDGARFFQAVKNNSFDLGEYDYTNVYDFNQNVPLDAVNGLMQSLGAESAND